MGLQPRPLFSTRCGFGSTRRARQAGALAENTVTLSPAFWDELRTHPIPVDTEVVRALANNPGCLDLYTWLTWRCYQAKDTQRIPLFGPMGLASQLGVQEYARERKFRERIGSGWNWSASAGPNVRPR